MNGPSPKDLKDFATKSLELYFSKKLDFKSYCNNINEDRIALAFMNVAFGHSEVSANDTSNSKMFTFLESSFDKKYDYHVVKKLYKLMQC
ncbi:MAG: hypothetical protein ABGX70_07840 [Psychrobacter sp.]